MLSLRPVTMNDAELLLHWRNDLETRRASFTFESICLEDHVRWLERALANPDRKLFIAEHDGIPIGTIRADLHPSGEWELHWTIAPEHRGKSLGREMLTEFLRTFPPAPVFARIKRSNIPSQAIAKKCGLFERVNNLEYREFFSARMP